MNTLAPFNFNNPVTPDPRGSRFSTYWQLALSPIIEAVNALITAASGILGVANGGTGADNTTQDYTPTPSDLVNLSAVNNFQCQYARLGVCVWISGLFQADAVAAAAASFQFDLPIASDFSFAGEAGGVAFDGGVAGEGIRISANVANNKIQFDWVPTVATNQTYNFIVMYRIR